MGEVFLLRCKTKLFFGFNVLERLGNFVKDLERALIVTGKSSAKLSGALDIVMKVLKEEGVDYVIYDKIKPNPTKDIVNEGAEIAWRECVDFVIGIGGGSVLDSSKAIALVTANGGDVWSYVKGLKRPKKILPVITINLTHGTGSEVDRYSVITNPETREKIGFGYDLTYPVVSFDDPKLTLTMPKRQVISTTLDAMYHALESSTTIDSSPYTIVLAEEVVKYVANYLPRALEDLNNVENRYWLMYASAIAGLAIDNSRTHVAHALEHAVSGYNPEIPHGEGLACLGSEVMELTYKARPNVMTRVLRPFIPGLSGKVEEASRVKEELRKFQENVSFTKTLRDYGIGVDDLKELTEIAYKSLRELLEIAPFPVSRDLIKELFIKSL